LKAKTISIHSSRGGTGKTVIATNLAALLAQKGFNVALLDVDFRAPSLCFIFSDAIHTPIHYWLNDFLHNKCREQQILIDISKNYVTKGELHIGLANPSIEAIRNMMQKSAAWEVSSAKKLFSLLSVFYKEMHIDYCILDTSPGVQFSSVNALASSDLSLIITSPDMVDLAGTTYLLNDIVDILGKRAYIILNKCSPEKEELDNTASILEHPLIARIPCYCEVLQAHRTGLLAIKKLDHPFVRKIEGVIEKIVE
jgi:MinD-like ATPase involved in chromosome partitioning or flagellar assembly